MSTFRIEVVPIVLEAHPDADSLSIVRVFDGYRCCVRTEDWQGISQGAYVPPESIVPDTPQFAFLEGKRRIKVRKMRGVESYGMLIPAPEGAQIGDDVAEQLGIVHYEPELAEQINESIKMANAPPFPGPIYDMENWLKYGRELKDNEEVVITEKIHGCNSRFTFQDGQMYCGSHNLWCKEGSNLYWNILKISPWVESFCRLNPDTVLFGEIYGAVQKNFKYGCTNEKPYGFRAFDVYYKGQFLDYDNALGNAKSDFLVPVLYRGPYSKEIVEKYMNGDSTIQGAENIREGVVIKPVKERWTPRLGRVILKAVSFDYLEETGKKKKK